MLKDIVEILGGRKSPLNPNILGLLFSIGTWVTGLSFFFYYHILDVELALVRNMFLISSAGFLSAAALFWKRKNVAAVIVLCGGMLFTLAYVIQIPVVGNYTNIFLSSVAVYPILLLERRKLEIMLLNFLVCVLFLTISEVMRDRNVEVTEQILGFLVKFTVLVFTFVQAYVIRLMYESREEVL